MKILFLVVIGSCNLINLNARLIEKNTDRTSTTETKPTGSESVRIARDIKYSNEVVKISNRKIRYVTKSPDNNTPLLLSADPMEIDDKNKSFHANSNQKTVLVKKPIPKYADLEYEEEFQAKVSKSAASKLSDSAENEDEDFSVDDYDFDVNHDEYAGRGKPLEPRSKTKDFRDKGTAKTESKAPPVIETMNPPQSKDPSRKQRSVDMLDKSDKDDYEYELPLKTSETLKALDREDDLSDEDIIEKIKESRILRMARSYQLSNGFV